MTKDELQKILSSENKFKVEQIRQFIYEMREDIYDGLCTHLIEEGFVGKYIEQFCLSFILTIVALGNFGQFCHLLGAVAQNVAHAPNTCGDVHQLGCGIHVTH